MQAQVELEEYAGIDIDCESFRRLINKALMGDDVACKVVVQLLMHEKHLFINPGNLNSFIQRIVGLLDFCRVSDNAKIIFGVLKYLNITNEVPNLEVVEQALTAVERPTTEVWHLRAKLALRGIGEPNAKPNYTKAKALYDALREAVIILRNLQSNAAHLDTINQNIAACHYELRKQRFTKTISNAGLMAHLYLSYGLNGLLNHLFEENKKDFNVRYHHALYGIESLHNENEELLNHKQALAQLLKENTDLFLSTLLSDELLSIDQVVSCLQEANIFAAIQSGKMRLSHSSLMNLAKFLIQWECYRCANQNEVGPAKRLHATKHLQFGEMLGSVMHTLSRTRSLEAEPTLQAQWSMAQVDLVLARSIGDDAEFGWICNELKPYLLHCNAAYMLLMYIHRQDISVAFDSNSKNALIAVLYDLYPLVAHVDPVRKAELQRIVVIDQQIPPERKGELQERFWDYVDYCERKLPLLVDGDGQNTLQPQKRQVQNLALAGSAQQLIQGHDQSPQHSLARAPERLNGAAATFKFFTYPKFCQKSQLRRVVHEVAQEVRGDAARFTHLVNYCDSVKEVTTFPWCMARVLDFLRHKETTLGRGTTAHCLMEKLATTYDIDFASVLKTEQTPAAIRNRFCAILESKFCGNSVSVALSNSVVAESTGRYSRK